MGAAEAHQSERICWKGATVVTRRGDPFVTKASGGKQSSEQISICEHSGGQNREDRTHGRLLAQLSSADKFLSWVPTHSSAAAGSPLELDYFFLDIARSDGGKDVQRHQLFLVSKAPDLPKYIPSQLTIHTTSFSCPKRPISPHKSPPNSQYIQTPSRVPTGVDLPTYLLTFLFSLPTNSVRGRGVRDVVC